MISLFHDVDPEQYIIATYYVQSTTTLKEAALNIAIGQSVGNPKERNTWETDELFLKHSCVVTQITAMIDDKAGLIDIAFPAANTDFATDGISHLLCQLMGGQLDIGIIEKCQLMNLRIPEIVKNEFKKNMGINSIREKTVCFDKPLLGGIIKPKTGLDEPMLKSMVEQMANNGINFIKEDEIMSNLPSFPLKERVKALQPILEYHKDVIYAFCINSDPLYLGDRVKTVVDNGGNGVHINIHSGFGSYRCIRDIAPNLYIHYQKSGDKLITNIKHDYHIRWRVLCQLAVLSGVDFIHAGMLGGYANDNIEALTDCFEILVDGNVLPALSCGMHPGLVDAIRKVFGNQWMANVGGALHGHPGGTGAGVRAMRQAIDGNHGEEYEQAIAKWGYTT
jgi:ribulose-bisphosphate carboxylase large chain